MKTGKISPLVILSFIWVQILSPMQVVFAQYNTDEKTAVAVADLDVTGVSEEEAQVLSSRLIAEVWKTRKYEVLERQKMDDILTEQGFQISGACEDQAKCLLEIGKLLPVEKIIGGSVGKIGNTWTVTLRMIDIGSGRIEKTVIRDCPNCSIDEILSPHLSYAAGELAGDEVEYAEITPDKNKTSLADAERQAAEQRRNINQNADLTMGQEKKGGGSIFSKWYFWVLVAGAGGGAAVALSSSGGDKNDGPATGNGSIVINWRK